jgi:hypothetical protein
VIGHQQCFPRRNPLRRQRPVLGRPCGSAVVHPGHAAGAVVVEYQNNGFGGSVAAPIAKQLMQAILPTASKASENNVRPIKVCKRLRAWLRRDCACRTEF